MSFDIRNVKSIDDLIRYFIEELHWNIDLDDFDEIDDITYDFDAADIGLKEEAFANISSLRQLQPISDYQKWGIFCVEFDSNRFVVSALRKILSGLVPKRRNAAEHAVWSQKDLLFLCFWGRDNNRTIGIAHFEDKENGLPLIKMISCAPAIEEFTNIKYFEEQLRHLSWVRDESDTEAWYEQWSSAFTASYREVIQTSSALTLKLAAEAQKIRNRILEIYDIETDDGYVHKIYDDFKQSLIHDMTVQQFADMYAQTVVYGLFSARCMDKTPEDFSAREAVDCIPITNPFLKRLMEECLGEGVKRHLTFDELEVSNVIDILLHTNTELILRDFNRQTGGGKEDPVIHFYEEFLTAYDKAQKVQRGVYYTPQPVVNFIVRAVDTILKTEFHLEDGLASEVQREILVDIEGKKRRERMRVPAVQILDPATGTGTFIRQTILQIYKNFRIKHKNMNEQQINSEWNSYVPKHLLTRLNAFELMMAPYAVAHMKLAMVLKDTGYDFNSNQRLKVFLTNSLEPAGKADFQLSLFEDDPLAFESIEANQTKKNGGINVIIGNPPYSVESANKGEWITNLLEDYKKEPGGRVKLKERNPKNINGDEYRFVRLGQYLIDRANSGVLAYIMPHGFLDNGTFRGMRWALLTAFSKIFILDLHGNANLGEVAPDGGKDENVFDIKQGVCIVIMVKAKDMQTKDLAQIFHYDVYGTREYKYSFLEKNTLNTVPFSQVTTDKPEYYFIKQDFLLKKEYTSFISLEDFFSSYTVGVQSGNDKTLINSNSATLLNNIFSLGENPNKDLIYKYDYRPFDYQYIYYDDKLVDRSRIKVMQHMIQTNNIALIATKLNRQISTGYFFITDSLVDRHILDTARDSTYAFPLFQYNAFNNSNDLNINPTTANKLLNPIGLKFNYDMSLSVLDYIYAVFHSNTYRRKYKEFLKSDFPRIPYPTNVDCFWKLVSLGSALRKCHLMQTDFDTEGYNYIGEGTREVIKPLFKNERVYINKTQYFDSVPLSLWEMYIGGYQPLQKWLKDRKKTILSSEDVEHYKKIIAALKLTQELMAQIDETVDF